MLFDKQYREATWKAGMIAYEASDFLGARNWAPAIASLFVQQDMARGETWKQAIDRAGIQFAEGGEDFIIGRADPIERAKAIAINPVTELSNIHCHIAQKCELPHYIYQNTHMLT